MQDFINRLRARMESDPQFQKEVLAAIARAASGDELSDLELEMVSGGKAIYNAGMGGVLLGLTAAGQIHF